MVFLRGSDADSSRPRENSSSKGNKGITIFHAFFFLGGGGGDSEADSSRLRDLGGGLGLFEPVGFGGLPGLKARVNFASWIRESWDVGTLQGFLEETQWTQGLPSRRPLIRGGG